MDYSLNLRKMSVGAMKGKELFIASPVCQNSVSHSRNLVSVRGGRYYRR